MREEVKRIVGRPSVHSTVETPNHSEEKGHPLMWIHGIVLWTIESRRMQLSQRRAWGKPYALIAYVRFE